MYRSLRGLANDISHDHVLDMVAHIEGDPAWYTSKALMEKLRSGIDESKEDLVDAAPRLLAAIQVLRKRFGIKI